GAVDGDMPAGIGEHGEDLGRRRGHGTLHFQSLRHKPIVARRPALIGISLLTGQNERRLVMEYRQLGRSGLRISALTLGTMTFGGRGGFQAVGATDVDGARRQVDMCLDAGVNLIDTADVYSGGLAEEITGEVIKGRRDSLLLSTKVRMSMGQGPNDGGLSRQHILAACEASLRRLRTDHIDIYHVHEWDGHNRLEENLSALNSLVDAGKVRYLAASNYAGWQLMKALAVADAHGYERFAAQQVYYSLEARD